MQRLGITSKAALQKLKDDGKIRYTQPEKKIILHDAESINRLLDWQVSLPFIIPLFEYFVPLIYTETAFSELKGQTALPPLLS